MPLHSTPGFRAVATALIRLVSALLIIGSWSPGAGAPLEVSIPWLEVRRADGGAPIDKAGIVVVTRASMGQESEHFLPVTAATMIAHQRAAPSAAQTGFRLRDNRWYQGLLRVDATAIPSGDTIVSAHFRAQLNWVERSGMSGSFACHRLQTAWAAETASWTTSGTNPAIAWDGLQADEHFDRIPFATTALTTITINRDVPLWLRMHGFETEVARWRENSGKNHGFLLTFSGPALECGIKLTGLPPSPPRLRRGQDLLLVPNLPLLSRLAAAGADDLIQAAVEFPSSTGALTTVSLHAAQIKPGSIVPESSTRSGGTATLPAAGSARSSDLAEVVRGWLTDSAPDAQPAMLLRVEGGGPTDFDQSPMLHLTWQTTPVDRIFHAPVAFVPGSYVTVQDGHLHYRGNRLRLWGVIGQPDVKRLVQLGFNAERLWSPRVGNVGQPGSLYTAASARRGEFAPSTQGDGGELDRTDQHMAELKEHGLFVMLAALTDSMPNSLLTRDDSFVADGAGDWPAWREAMLANKGKPQHFVYLDERLQKARKQHARNLLTHVNPYTGQAYGAEEHVAMYEVFNENGFIRAAMAGDTTDWPAYFQEKLKVRWNTWLQARYGATGNIRTAWGALLPGEEVERRSVAFDSASWNKLLQPPVRTADRVRFLVELVDTFHQEFRGWCRALFPAGVGVNVAPFSFDTLYRPDLAWSYANARGDVNSFGMYFWDLHSALDRPPSAYVLDTSTVEGVPTVIYETNHGRPGPFRAGYPFRLAALASWQDWDAVFWHYWGPQGGSSPLGYLTGTLMPPTTDHYWNAVHHELDPVMGSAFAMAGRLFLEGRIAPAPDPATITITGDTIFSATPFPPGAVAPLTFIRGTRLRFRPEETGAATLDGAPLPALGRITTAVHSGTELVWDWPNDRLLIDAATAHAAIGRTTPSHTFSSGITLDQPSAPWMAFAVLSADFRPLASVEANRTFWMAGVADARNTAFDFDFSVTGGPTDQARAVRNRGVAPILVDPVNYRLSFPRAINSGRQRDFDFALRPFRTTTPNRTFTVDQKSPTPLLSELNVTTWGESRDPHVVPPKPTAAESRSSSAATGSGGTSPPADSLAAAWLIAGLDWTWTAPQVVTYFASPMASAASVQQRTSSTGTIERIEATGVPLAAPWASAADLIFHFRSDSLVELEVIPHTPPALGMLVAFLQPSLGAPDENVLESQTGTSRLRWSNRPPQPAVSITESQGTMRIQLSFTVP